MATTETATEREAIQTLVQMYIEGDAAKLNEAFHKEA